MKRLILIILINLLFWLNYLICCAIYPDRPETIISHYDLRFNIYALVFLLWGIYTQCKIDIKYESYVNVGCYAAFGVFGADVTDRAMQIYSFNLFDILIILIFIFIGIKKHLPVTFNKLWSMVLKK